MQIDTAMNGKEALDKIKTNRYDLILMDHMMPIMDGVETTKCLRKMEGKYYQNVPVIALSADAMHESQKIFAEAGMNDFAAKPIELRQLCKVLRRWLPLKLIIKTQCPPFEHKHKK